MERVPFDLRRRAVREEYLENHKKWFLKNHENTIRKFEESVQELYTSDSRESEQLRLLGGAENY